ncbi:MAG: AI-2E family transporter [Isosphaeraceae bacterium]
MANRRSPFRMDHPVIVTFLIIAIVASMSLAGEVLKPLALAILLSFCLTPVAAFLERRRLPRALAVILTVVLSLGVLSGVGYVVGSQLTSLANDLPKYQERMIEKVDTLVKPKQDSALTRANKVVSNVAAHMDAPTTMQGRGPNVQDVRVVEAPSFRQRLQTAVGPYLEFVGVSFFVLILVLFIMLNREDLNDRIIRLAGNRQISLTTRTMGEVGQRVSRYLATFAAVNSVIGLIVGLGLWAIGLPLAALWGFLAAALRFIPYVGPTTAFLLPLVFSVAVAPMGSWLLPIEVLVLFGVMELVANSFLEPIIYGKTTGVSALGLLVAAMFWTWLWGALGLLLSTPMTVCLAVLGKYVPSLRFFATLLGEEAALDPDVKFYQRLLASDQDGAEDVVEEALRTRPRVEVFDQVLIPTLSRAERDAARQEIDEREQAFVWRVVGDLIDDLEGEPDLSLKTLSAQGKNQARDQAQTTVTAKLVGVAANDQADALVLRMLAQVLEPLGCRCQLEIMPAGESPLKLAEAIASHEPDLVVLSHLPPVGLTSARYLVRRLHVQAPKLPILVGRWGEGNLSTSLTERLTSAGASGVASSLADARDRILKTIGAVPPETKAAPTLASTAP